MRKEDMTAVDLLLEAVAIVTGLIYIGLQIYYGVLYGADILTLGMNILVFLLVYVGLSLLEIYPERVNRISHEMCQGKIRKYTIRMVRLIKIIFIVSLFFTSVCDVMGLHIESAYSLVVIGLILFITVYYEGKIIHILKNQHK